MIISNSGYICLGKQTAKGTASAPTIFIPYLSESWSTGQNIIDLKDGEEYIRDELKEAHTEGFGFSVYARPNLSSYMLGWVLGDSSIAGAGDPYTHTLVRGERPFLTIDRKITTGQVQRLTDAKIETITIKGDAGKPVVIDIQGKALTARIKSTETPAVYETRRPFVFYDGSGRFKFATTADDLIKSFAIKLFVDSSGGLNGDEILLEDLPDFFYGAECSFQIYTTNLTRWKNINYGGGTAPSESVYKAGIEIDLKYTENVADDRQLKISIPSLIWKTIGGLNLSSDPKTHIENVAGVAKKQATTELVTILMKNAISTTII